LKVREQREKRLARELAEAIESNEHSIYSLLKAVSDWQRASNNYGALLSLAERRLLLRTRRAERELIRDHLQAAIEEERDILHEARKHFSDAMSAASKLLDSLRDAKAEMQQVKLTFQKESSEKARGFLDGVGHIGEMSANLLSKVNAWLVETDAVVNRAGSKTTACMKKRIAEMLEMKKILEEEIEQTSDAIIVAKRKLEKMRQQIKEHNEAPESHMGINRDGAHSRVISTIKNNPALNKLRAKIKGAAYTGFSGRQLDIVFARFDKDGSGELEPDEVRSALRRSLHLPHTLLSDAEISILCGALDSDNSGAISVAELVEFLAADVDVVDLGRQCQATESTLERMTVALNQMKEDLRGKISAWRIDVACLKLTTAKALDSLDVRCPVEKARGKRRPAPLAPEDLELVRSRIKMAAYTGHAGRQLDAVFNRFDKDHSGQLGDDEIRKVLRGTLRIAASTISDAEIASLCGLLDSDNSGTVSISELVSFVGPEPASRRLSARSSAPPRLERKAAKKSKPQARYGSMSRSHDLPLSAR